VESMATQTLVLLIIRTRGNPFKSRPSRPLLITTLIIVVVAVVLPMTPLGPPLGFTLLPGIFYEFLIGATLVYLGMVELGKRLLISRTAVA
jgi:Mg2+-importing ATPase